MSTPVRRQYLEQKARHPDAILFFRLGDFYETFDEDAKLVAAELDIALTAKSMGGGLRVPLAGVPVRSVEQHLTRLVGRGHRVAICEQLEDPRASRGLVRRGVVRVVSPGTALEPALLEAGEASACAAAWLTRSGAELVLGLAAAEITSGACRVAELRGRRGGEAALWQRARELLERLGARELVLSEDAGEPDLGLPLPRRPRREFRAEAAARALAAQYGAPAAAFGLDARPAALIALGALLSYLNEALAGSAAAGARSAPAHLAAPRWFELEQYLSWDRATERALALLDAGPQERAGGGTLLGVIDRCSSAAGRRWLRAALRAPLVERERIERRLERIEALLERPGLRRAVGERLRGSADLERLLGRAASGLAAPPELAALANGLLAAAGLAEALRGAEADDHASALDGLAERLEPAPEAARRLAEALEPRPASEFGGGVVRAGVDAQVDRGRAALEQAQQQLAELERSLRRESGIEGLRVNRQRTFGYLIELGRAQAARAPADWERRQSLRDRERFTEPRLARLEREIEAAEAGLAEAERLLVEQLRAALVAEAAAVRRIAGALARLDAAAALAALAAERNWTRPQLEHTGELEIEGGRHPIVEAAAAEGGFVPNDLRLADDGRRAPQLLLVTGPNMAGKSTYLRQAALIVILAQLGSFVPAARARVGLVDRIFARVGAHDDLAGGRSTFMVEMLETARLLHGATARSLVLLDEIGRGTSTWDGLAIARAVAESLAGGPGAPAERRERGPRTLFATHFHELTALAGSLERAANAAVLVEETEAGGLEFLYRVEAGAADRSYGVQVAAQAGLPAEVIERARTLLGELERAPRGPPPLAAAAAGPGGPQLMLMPPAPHPLLHDLAELDVDGITPLEAISALYALREQARAELRGLQPERPERRAEAGS